jgi:uncharacterized protein (DUF488 family)
LPGDFLELLSQHGIKAVVDVRLRPDKASLGSYIKAKTREKGIQRLLEERGIEYHSLIDLGNLFIGYTDWDEKYNILIDKVGDLLLSNIQHIPIPFCLMCCEKEAAKCHRKIIANYLVKQGCEVEHIE